MYIVVAVGHEGLDNVFWAGADPNEAREKLLACRKRLAELNALPDDERYDTGGPWFSLYEPARICVQKQVTDRFECCCKELGVSVKGGPYLY